ncbi:peptidylprolyl isomerase [Saccharophagus degradans]|uniref:FKBP-type peptidyl-prolyl cis-trans isomerase n=1 Tax=Saccharophagus degradans TaxID=86304 RepID=UPI001C093D4B|nr:peptidylprolyl isomerase [Saccharophagus degradans]MBU2986088.1 peptidylprolyl isomerase [Saccharophagus degradans]WGO97493.1 peptidylprolyl isomerase [Saccharophagus degradans]
MKIQENSVVSIHYTLKGEDGAVLDTSDGGEPLNYLQGAGNIIPGLEDALLDKAVGEEVNVTVQPKEGYGEIIPELIQKMPTDAFSGIDKIEVGMEFQAQTESGGVQYVVVTAVEDDGITIDGNHALAGKVLNFEVKIEAVREASEEEIAHGHVH